MVKIYLTERQNQIYKLFVRGFSQKQIGLALGINQGRVSRTLKEIRKKVERVGLTLPKSMLKKYEEVDLRDIQ